MNFDFSFLSQYDSWIRLLHVAGAIIAIGSVVATDLILMWLKLKPQHAQFVAKISPLLSLQVWIGFLMLSISGILLFLPMQGLAEVPIFQLKMLLVFVVFINGIILNLWVSPRFEKLAPEWHLKTRAVKKFTLVAGITAAVSFIGWWSIIVLMMIYY